MSLSFYLKPHDFCKNKFQAFLKNEKCVNLTKLLNRLTKSVSTNFGKKTIFINLRIFLEEAIDFLKKIEI